MEQKSVFLMKIQAELLVTVYGKKKDILFEKTAYEPKQTIQEVLKTWKRNGIDVGEVATSSGVAVQNNGTGAKPPLSGPTFNGIIPQSAKKSRVDSENALQKMRDAFVRRKEILGNNTKEMIWTDIAREYADGKVLSNEADSKILQEIIDMAKEDYQWGESKQVLYAISQNSSFTKTVRDKAAAAYRWIEKKTADEFIQKTKEDAEKSKTVQEKDKDVETFLKRFAPQMDAIIAKNRIAARGNQYDDDLKSIAMIAAAKAYEEFDPAKGASLDTAASEYVTNAIIDFNRAQKRDFEKSGGRVSLDQTNE